jgi:PAS domain S-box-containing protein
LPAVKRKAPFRLHASPESDVAHLLIPEVHTSPSHNRTHKGSILVIDDESASLKVLFTILTEDGYAVHERKLNLESQLRFVKDAMPDLVLVDVRKPGMDGYQVCASLKNDPITRAIPVIYISSIDRSIDQAKALLSGAVDYVTDPFDAEEVSWRIETHISLRRLREDLESAAGNHGARPVGPSEDLERAFQEIRVLTQVTGRKHAEEKVRQAARELKKAEEALKSSERNLSLMINAIPILIQVSRPDGTVLSVNQAVLDYYGLSLEDIQKEDFRNRFYHPDDVERLREKRKEALIRLLPFEYEQRALGKDGRYRWFLVRYNPLLDELGMIDRWYVAAFDIEDRKRAEAQVEQAYLRLAEAQRLSKTGSFITDLVADDHNWSEEAFRIFEFDPATQVTVKRIRDIVHPEDLPTFDAVIARGMTGTDVDFVFRIVTPRGTVKHLRGMARLLAQVADHPLFVGALQDVTESKLAEEALDRARSELAHVARVAMLNTFTASMAHELNQPLSGIITNAGTCLRMLDGDPPNIDGARETARRTIRDGNRASDVITRLRDLFSKKEFTLGPLDLNEATREVIALSLSYLQRDGVVVQLELSDELPQVMGDRIQLQQVVLNLLRNASDAMRTVQDRPRQLLIRTQRDDEDRVRLTVKDVGIGFSPEAQNKLFEAFYTTKSKGMGIGLSVSRAIIERHHGHLWAEPNDGPGATFSFSIPRRPESAPGPALQ